jgi:hypothetical protein
MWLTPSQAGDGAVRCSSSQFRASDRQVDATRHPRAGRAGQVGRWACGEGRPDLPGFWTRWGAHGAPHAVPVAGSVNGTKVGDGATFSWGRPRGGLNGLGLARPARGLGLTQCGEGGDSGQREEGAHGGLTPVAEAVERWSRGCPTSASAGWTSTRARPRRRWSRPRRTTLGSG